MSAHRGTGRSVGSTRTVGSTQIAPFGDDVSTLPLCGRSMDRFRREEIEQAGLEPSRLTFADYAIATSPVLRALAAQGRGPRRLALPETHPAAAYLAPISSAERADGLLLFDIFIDADGEETLEELRAHTTPTCIDPPGRHERRELPRTGPEPHHLDVPSDGIVAAHVEHWAHVLWLAPLLVPALLGRMKPNHRAPHDLAPSVVGEGATIHPTAHIEGSIIGSGAEVGAFCSIRNSYVGPGSKLADFTKVTASVLEDQTRTLADASFSHVVSFGDSTLASLLLRDTLLGREVFLTTGVIFWNESIDETIQVEHRGRWIDTGRTNLGGCAGHRASLGARTIVAPGRALPNGTIVVMRREEGVLRVEPAPSGTPMCWDNAKLVPFDRLRPGVVPDELA